MTTTDPKLIERASLIAEQAYSAGNLVTCDGYYEFDLDAAGAVIASAIDEAVAAERAGKWRGIESAPRDGTVIDVWRDEGGRETVYWGLPPHTCGEMGQYCDSDWHSIKEPGWVCSTFGEFVGGKHNPFIHWQPITPPARTANVV